PGGLRTTSFLLPTRNVAILGGYAGCGAPDPDERKLGVYHSILSGDLNGDDFSGGDMSDNAYHVVFAGNTTSTIILDGFVIEGGNANSVDNPNERGGGIFVFFTAANPTIRNCIIRRNTASAKGGGMYAASMTGLLINCVFTGNWAPDGGAIFNVNGNMELVNCTFSGNTATHNGGGIYLASPDALVLTNSVLWGNSDGGGMDESAQINLVGRPVVATYNCIQGWTGQHPGVGNFGDDPMFTDADGGDNLPGTGDDDLRLLLGSPCINSGDPSFTPFGSTDLAGVARVLCGRIDRGAYESGLGDIDCDGSVDMSDFSVWSDCMTGPEVAGLLDGCEPFDFTGDGRVTLDDFAAFQIAFSPAAR
ncbi:MAG: right-handed parallel beta-helix repeat-containing protein, partial [Phycisphaerae bacterium]